MSRFAAILAFFLSGCGSLDLLKVPDLDLAPPKPRLAAATSLELEEALQCTGRLVDIFYGPRKGDAPLLLIGIEGYPSLVPSSVAVPAQVPSDVTAVLQSVLDSMGPAVRYDLTPARGGGRPADVSLFMIGKVLYATSLTAQSQRGLDLGFILSGRDLSSQGNERSQVTLGALELALDVTGPGRPISIGGGTAPIVIVVDRTRINDQSISVSIGGTAFGWNQVDRVVHTFASALRYGVALQVIKLIGRTQNLPYWKCSPAFTADKLVKDSRIENFRAIYAKDPNEALRRLHMLQVYNGVITDWQPGMEVEQAHFPDWDMAGDEPAEVIYWRLFEGTARQGDDVIKAAQVWELERTAAMPTRAPAVQAPLQLKVAPPKLVPARMRPVAPLRATPVPPAPAPPVGPMLARPRVILG